MKIGASTIEGFFEQSGAHAEALRQMDECIQRYLPDFDRKLYTSDTTCVLGYGEIPYKNTNYSGTIPILSIAPQKNGVSMYLMAWKDGQYLAELYAQKLGKTSNGKSCVRFKKFSDLNMDGLQDLFRDLRDIYRSIIDNG